MKARFSYMELWDAYDKNFKKIDGMVLVRGEEKNIPDGVFHLVCGVLVKHADGTFLITKRDKNKVHGGMWEATCGGSALLGETPYMCAIRECYEETGINVSNLTEIGRIFRKEEHCVCFEFLCITDCDKESIILQKGETCDYKWISYNELMDLGEDKLLAKSKFELFNFSVY